MFGKIKAVIHTQLTQGLSIPACSAAIATAFTIGIFPIMGCSTPMNTAAAVLFRLNQPVVQAFNWVLGPLKIALIFPFLRFGEWVFQADAFALSLTEFSKRFFNDWRSTTAEFGWTFVHAIVGWLIWAPLVYLMLYWLACSLVKRVRLRNH